MTFEAHFLIFKMGITIIGLTTIVMIAKLDNTYNHIKHTYNQIGTFIITLMPRLWEQSP
jgi:hypothetical protein